MTDFELENIEKRDKIDIFILGSNFPEDEKQKRMKLCCELRDQRKFSKAYIMEDRYNPDTHKYVDETFKDFIHGSDLIIAILTQEGSKDGVGWEIGFMQGVDFLSDKFNIREKLIMCLENDVDKKPELTEMISKGIIKKEGCRIVRFNTIDELCNTLESICHSHLIKISEN